MGGNKETFVVSIWGFTVEFFQIKQSHTDKNLGFKNLLG